MGRNCDRFQLLFLFGFLAFLSGCAHTPAESTNSRNIYVPAIASLKPADYSREIDKNRQIIQRDLHLNAQQKAHLNLACLYSSPLNPIRNYKLAQKHLEAYALLDPDFKNAVDPRTLLAALFEIEQLSNQATAQALEMQEISQELAILKRQARASLGDHQHFRKENLRLNKRVWKLQNRIRSLEASNRQLSETLEMLSTLDSQLEEKRSNFIKKGPTEEN
jgi:hypothetical protein